MKKLILIFSLVALLTLSSCGNWKMDMNMTFDYAYILLPNGTCVEGHLDYWDHPYDNQFIVSIDGVKYMTDTRNCTLIRRK